MTLSHREKLHRESEEHSRRHQRFQTHYREHCDRLLEALLPRVDAESLARLETTGFRFREDLVGMMERDRKHCLSELAKLDEQFGQDLNAIIDDEPSSELDKLEEHLDALQPFLKKCFQHPRFESLLLDGYGTDAYPKRFWHFSYYADLRAAQEIVEMCGGRNFKSIRREAIQAFEASQVLKSRIETLQQRQHEMVAAARQKRALEERLRKHPQFWLSFARRKLLELLDSDPTRAFEKSQAAAPEESLAWRLSKELCKKHWSLETRFLAPAREALEDGRRGTSQKLLNEYEALAESVQKFDQPNSAQESIDWNALIYRENS